MVCAFFSSQQVEPRNPAFRIAHIANQRYLCRWLTLICDAFICIFRRVVITKDTNLAMRGWQDTSMRRVSLFKVMNRSLLTVMEHATEQRPALKHDIAQILRVCHSSCICPDRKDMLNPMRPYRKWIVHQRSLPVSAAAWCADRLQVRVGKTSSPVRAHKFNARARSPYLRVKINGYRVCR